jgi:hypothetical protein
VHNLLGRPIQHNVVDGKQETSLIIGAQHASAEDRRRNIDRKVHKGLHEITQQGILYRLLL